MSITRGPDHTEKACIDGWNIVHNLLDISKQKAIQPIYSNNIIMLYNGEIYSPTSNTCDTYNIIPLYQQYGCSFVKHIVGEYAIVIVDNNINKMYLYADIFATKPLFYSVNDVNISVASYASELCLLGCNNIQRVMHSTYIEIHLDNNNITTHNYHSFNLDEYKTDYKDCIAALENALTVRCNDKVAVGLSSGHDSGSILLHSILHSNINNVFYHVTNGREDNNVMKQRYTLCDENNILYKIIDYYKSTNIMDSIELQKLAIQMEEFQYFYNENSMCQISKMLSNIKRDGINIFITGQGADEIMTNYKHYNFYKHLNLKQQFPWNNFYSGKNRKFIDEFEYIGGVYGVEVRYPFLDKHFVQEWLNLDNTLKCNEFKSILTHYMQSNNFPINVSKVGMGILNNRYFQSKDIYC